MLSPYKVLGRLLSILNLKLISLSSNNSLFLLITSLSNNLILYLFLTVLTLISSITSILYLLPDCISPNKLFFSINNNSGVSIDI